MAWLDFQNDGDSVVGGEAEAAKFDALLAKLAAAGRRGRRRMDGLRAQTRALLDRFDQARSDSGSLQDDSTFSDHFDALPADSIAKAWVRGDAAQGKAFDERLDQAGLPAELTKSTFETQLDALTAVTPAPTGSRSPPPSPVTSTRRQ